MQNRFGGRIQITREAIAALLGLPEGVRIDLFFDYEKNIYQILMESRDQLILNGQQITFPIDEGTVVPLVEYHITERPQTILTFGVEETPEPQPKDILDDFNDLLNH